MKVSESMKWKWRSMMKYPCIALSVTYSTPFFLGTCEPSQSSLTCFRPGVKVWHVTLKSFERHVAASWVTQCHLSAAGFLVFSRSEMSWIWMDLGGFVGLGRQQCPNASYQKTITDCYRLLAGTVEPKVTARTEIRKV